MYGPMAALDVLTVANGLLLSGCGEWLDGRCFDRILSMLNRRVMIVILLRYLLIKSYCFLLDSVLLRNIRNKDDLNNTTTRSFQRHQVLKVNFLVQPMSFRHGRSWYVIKTYSFYCNQCKIVINPLYMCSRH